MALEVVEELLSKELTQLESDADYQKTLGQARGSAATYFEGLALQLTKTMSTFVPEIKPSFRVLWVVSQIFVRMLFRVRYPLSSMASREEVLRDCVAHGFLICCRAT
jgi:hypothetical protein